MTGFDRYSFGGTVKRAAGAGLLSVALVASVSGIGNVGTAWADDDVKKDEVVYVKDDASGKASGIYVVNIFDTDTATSVSDPSNYTKVTNLTTNDDLQQADGAVKLTTTEGEPFYYQGEMDASSQLPWDISFTYYLDDQEVQADELAGADGEVRIVLDVKALDDGSDVADFAQSYILQAQGTFAEENFVISDAGDATLAHSGSNQVVSAMVLPGESETFEITGTAKNFESDGWQIAGMSLSMAIDLADQDTSKLTDSCQELEDATSKLSDGGSELEDGASDLSDGADELADGTGSLSDGASKLSDGTSKLSDGAGKVASGASSLSDGASKLESGVDSVVSGVEQVASGSSQYLSGLESSAQQYASGAGALESSKTDYANAVDAVQQAAAAEEKEPSEANAATLNAAIAAMNEAAQSMTKNAGDAGAYQALTGVAEKYESVNDGVQALAGNAGQLSSAASSVASGASEVASGADSVASASDSVDSGASELASGAQSVDSGATSLADGASSLKDGASSLSDGAKTLAESVEGMDDKILDELQETIDEKLGADFRAHSYVSSSNTNVDDVQFVYVVDAITVPDDESDDEEEEPNPSLLDRFFALFQ